MAFPSVVQRNYSEDDSGFDTSHTITIRGAAPTSGNLIIVAVTAYSSGAQTIALSGGFTELSETDEGTVAQALYAKVASGSENATETVTLATNAYVSAASYEISGWAGTISTDVDHAVSTIGYSQNPDPPSVTAGWGADDNLALTFVGGRGSGAAITGGPSGWANYQSITAGSASLSVSTGGAELETTSSLADPGTFASGYANWVKRTIIIEPAAAAAGQPAIKRFGGVPFMAINRRVW